MNNGTGLDIFGIKPIANAIDSTVKKSLEGIEGFLQLVCAPALDEIGLLLQDKVRYWRLNNVISMLEKAKGKLVFTNDKLELKSHPRVALSIIENSSLIDNTEVQDMWAGLFASSCTESGQDDENLMFVDLLKQLTTAQVKLIKFGVEHSKKIVFPNGLIMAESVTIQCDKITELTNIKNFYRIDRELDYLSSLGLISPLNGGFDAESTNLIADISPTYLSLSLYVKSQGSSLNPNEYWKEELITKEEYDRPKEQKKV